METANNPFGLDFPGRFEVQSGLPKGDKRTSQAKKTVSVYSGAFQAYLDFAERNPQPSSGHAQNREQFVNQLVDDRSGFKGGTFESLFAPITDFEKYSEAQKTLTKSDVWKRVQNAFSEQMQRRRIRCSYDGEYDLDKRWDAEPFSRRSRAPQMSRRVKFHVNCTFSGGVGAKKINEYGAFAAAIVNLLEQNGVGVDVILMYVTASPTGDDSTVAETRLTLKRADEYLPVGEILRAFSSNFYRRAGFSLIVAGAENLGSKVCEGLGRPYEFGSVFEVDGNEVYLFSAPDLEAQYRIVEEVVKAITQKEGTK